jgi:glycosyltransferase involved in cell wall biosynthesis
LVRYVESLETEAWSHCQELIAVDSGQERILMEQGAAQDDISVIFNAVDTREIDRSRTATSPFPFPYLLVPRHLVPKNGVEYAIRALSRLADSPVRLISAGDGFLRSQLRRLACGLGIGDRVVFLGRIPRDRVLSLMWHASAVIVPSVSVAGVEEATSFSAIEAMAAGRPVIASAIGGLTELIQDGENGYLVPQKDPGALCAALRAILANPSLAARLGEQARATVLARFSTAQWIPQITAVYQRALRARKELSALS